MESPLLCPVCQKALWAYESFYMCPDCHQVEKDCRKNLVFPKRSTRRATLPQTKALSDLFAKGPLSFLADEFTGSLKKFQNPAGDIAILSAFDDALCHRLAQSLPEAKLYALVNCGSRIKTFSSRDNLLFIEAPEEAIRSESMDAVICFERRFEASHRILKSCGLYLEAIPGPKFGRELFCYGFSPPDKAQGSRPETFRMREGFVMEKRFFLNAKEVLLLHRLLHPKKDAPEGLSDFKGGFVTLEFMVSCYEKRRPQHWRMKD